MSKHKLRGDDILCVTYNSYVSTAQATSRLTRYCPHCGDKLPRNLIKKTKKNHAPRL